MHFSAFGQGANEREVERKDLPVDFCKFPGFVFFNLLNKKFIYQIPSKAKSF